MICVEMVRRSKLQQEDAPGLTPRDVERPELPGLALNEVPVEALSTEFLIAPGIADFLGIFDSFLDGPVQRFRKEVLQEALAVVHFFQHALNLLRGRHQLNSMQPSGRSLRPAGGRLNAWPSRPDAYRGEPALFGHSICASARRSRQNML